MWGIVHISFLTALPVQGTYDRLNDMLSRKFDLPWRCHACHSYVDDLVLSAMLHHLLSACYNANWLWCLWSITCLYASSVLPKVLCLHHCLHF